VGDGKRIGVIASDARWGSASRGASSDDEIRSHLLSYILANAAASEVVALENYSQMVHLMPTTQAKVEAASVAHNEGQHVLLLLQLSRILNITIHRGKAESHWRGIRRHFAAAVARQDLAACLIIQDVIVKALNIPLYQALAAAENDPQTAAIAGSILADEFEHLEIGIWRLRAMLAADGEGVIDGLRWAHYRVMQELRGINDLDCDDCLRGKDCGNVGFARGRTYIAELRKCSMERYHEMLFSLFEAAVVRPLLIGLPARGRIHNLDRIAATVRAGAG
jgi:fatty aldehyde decarbonylase